MEEGIVLTVKLTDRRRTILKLYGPNHEKTRDFFQKEEKNIRVWNQAAKKLGEGHHFSLLLKKIVEAHEVLQGYNERRAE
jgi:hypothetical protein